MSSASNKSEVVKLTELQELMRVSRTNGPTGMITPEIVVQIASLREMYMSNRLSTDQLYEEATQIVLDAQMGFHIDMVEALRDIASNNVSTLMLDDKERKQVEKWVAETKQTGNPKSIDGTYQMPSASGKLVDQLNARPATDIGENILKIAHNHQACNRTINRSLDFLDQMNLLLDDAQSGGKKEFSDIKATTQNLRGKLERLLHTRSFQTYEKIFPEHAAHIEKTLTQGVQQCAETLYKTLPIPSKFTTEASKPKPDLNRVNEPLQPLRTPKSGPSRD